MTRARNLRAAALFATWRREGAPEWVTAHEAWRLSGGLTGSEGDHAGEYRLVDVATTTARREATR